MMAMITAKLARMRWRNVQFFTVKPRAFEMLGSIAEGGTGPVWRFEGIFDEGEARSFLKMSNAPVGASLLAIAACQTTRL
ncbi:hypothetical protein EMIT043CA1_210065 [Pseudomonas brassicacearum]